MITQHLNFPEYDFKIKGINGRPFIFDKIRKRFVALTLEEWVRQNMIEFLTIEKKYPSGRFGNEVKLNINGMPKRCDSVFYDEKANPLLIIEYKAPHIKITQSVFDQIATYNLPLQAKYILVSNGLEHFFCEIDYKLHKYIFFNEIPAFNTLMSSVV